MLEPWLKISLTLLGITFELWSGEPYFEMRCGTSGHDTVLTLHIPGRTLWTQIWTIHADDMKGRRILVVCMRCRAKDAGHQQGNLMSC